MSATGVRVIPGSATGKSPCEKAAPTPASPGEVGAGAGGSAAVDSTAGVEAGEHGVRGMVQQVPLTHGASRARSTRRWPRPSTVVEGVPDGEGRGRGRLRDVDGVRAVHRRALHEHRLADAASIPRTRRSCCTTGTSPDSKIVGLSYLVYHPDGPPPGFAGPNDHWHQHNANGGLCLKGGVVVGGEESTRQQCAAMGGRKTLLTDVWMVHAWVVPGFECGWGVFSGECPELGGTLGGTASTVRTRARSRSRDRQSALSRAATRSRCAAGGSPSRRALRARRASTCPGPSRARAARG